MNAQRTKTAHEGADVNNTLLSMINPLTNALPMQRTNDIILSKNSVLIPTIEGLILNW